MYCFEIGEHLWQWLREDITYHVCYDQEQELIDAVTNFQNQINTNPVAVSDRLWVKKHLESKEEYHFSLKLHLMF